MPNRQETIGINIAFNADARQAQAQIRSLKTSIDDLLKGNSAFGKSDNGILSLFNKDIQNAEKNLLSLKTALNNSVDESTGKLDLTKFNNSLKQTGTTLSNYRDSLVSLGPQGVKTFDQLSKAIIGANTNIKQGNTLLDNFTKSIGNTIKWQLSTNIVNSLFQTVSGAVNYAQRLDTSLTNISIVTGKSREEMAAFAQEASKAAEALSTTTTNYTDAYLIYAQQGLGEAEANARTETTVKLANVTGKTASSVSSELTAIWNNFYDGSQSLESFADKITALGAATASSSSEIATGLQQFASIGQTVGLSYDYATTALATVVAQTRQSASVVGNSFRTLFSRFQGLLQDGETEDGVSLNKYSKALQEVGVEILGANGQLKDMDTILDDLGAKWNNLTQAQKIATAETVGGREGRVAA